MSDPTGRGVHWNPGEPSDYDSPPFQTPDRYAALICPIHGDVFITQLDYVGQLDKPDVAWACPQCGEHCEWNDGWWEEATGASDKGWLYEPEWFDEPDYQEEF